MFNVCLGFPFLGQIWKTDGFSMCKNGLPDEVRGQPGFPESSFTVRLTVDAITFLPSLFTDVLFTIFNLRRSQQ